MRELSIFYMESPMTCQAIQHSEIRINVSEIGYPKSVHIITEDRIYQVSCLPTAPSPSNSRPKPTCGYSSTVDQSPPVSK